MSQVTLPENNGYYNGYIGTRPLVTEQGLKIVRLALVALGLIALSVGTASLLVYGGLPITAVALTIGALAITALVLSYLAQNQIRGRLTEEQIETLIDMRATPDEFGEQLKQISGSRYSKIAGAYRGRGDMARLFTKQEGCFNMHIDSILKSPKKAFCFLISLAYQANPEPAYKQSDEQKPCLDKENPIYVIQEPETELPYSVIRDIENPILGF